MHPELRALTPPFTITLTIPNFDSGVACETATARPGSSVAMLRTKATISLNKLNILRSCNADKTKKGL